MREIAEHHLKTWPEYFREVCNGSKTFELRVNDRDFQPGDILVLKEFVPENFGSYTGREIRKRVGYVLYGGAFGLPENMCIMSLLDFVGEAK